ncbi:MAG: hypothetical protein MJE77_45955 [Proteobacteria bacterium]|nr:hypothetical protein [Pseudomonadota bacterium]
MEPKKEERTKTHIILTHEQRNGHSKATFQVRGSDSVMIAVAIAVLMVALVAILAV